MIIAREVAIPARLTDSLSESETRHKNKKTTIGEDTIVGKAQ